MQRMVSRGGIPPRTHRKSRNAQVCPAGRGKTNYLVEDDVHCHPTECVTMGPWGPQLGCGDLEACLIYVLFPEPLQRYQNAPFRWNSPVPKVCPLSRPKHTNVVLVVDPRRGGSLTYVDVGIPDARRPSTQPSRYEVHRIEIFMFDY